MRLRPSNGGPLEVEHVFHYDDGSTAVEIVREAKAAGTGDDASPRPRRPSLATLLTEAGIATEEQIRDALAEGTRTGEKLGEVVVRRGWASEVRLAGLLAEQWQLSVVEASTLSLDPLAVSRVEVGVATELGGLPIRLDDKGVAVVAVDEPSEERFAAFRELLGDASFVVVPRSTLRALLESRVVGEVPREPRTGAVELVRTWTAAAPSAGPPGLEPADDAAPPEPQAPQAGVQRPASPREAEPVEAGGPSRDEASAAGVTPGSAAERLRSLAAEVDALEEALDDARRTVEAQAAELAEARAARGRDLETIRRLEDQLADRGHRFQALREKVAELSVALDG